MIEPLNPPYMINPKDITILVQGKLHKHTLSRIQKYRKWGHILIGCDLQDDASVLEQYNLEGCEVAYLDISIAPTTFDCFRVYRQCKSIYEGLKHVKTPYAMKVRSDYWHGNLEPFIAKMSEYPNKFVTNNMYFRPDYVAKYHISDHMVGGKTEDMLKGYEICCHRLENHSQEMHEGFNDHRFLDNDKWEYWEGKPGHQTPNNNIFLDGTGRGVAPEVLIGTSLVVAKGFKATREDSKEKMKQCFEIVRVEDMLPHLNKYFTSEITHSGPEIHDIKDI
jgi:hypothetical protein